MRLFDLTRRDNTIMHIVGSIHPRVGYDISNTMEDLYIYRARIPGNLVATQIKPVCCFEDLGLRRTCSAFVGIVAHVPRSKRDACKPEHVNLFAKNIAEFERLYFLLFL